MKRKNESGQESNSADAYTFCLYIVGASPNSSRAITNLKGFFDKYLGKKYKLEIVDVYQQPHMAQSVDIIALPLLIKKYPLPQRRLIGDMSDNAKLLKSLNLTH